MKTPPEPARVLIVDDEDIYTRALRRSLLPHEVVVADDGRQALLLLSGDADFDVILCDLVMPGMSGMELHDAVARAQPHLTRRMIFMTGGAFSPRALDFLARIENLHLDKPIDLPRLRSLVVERAAARRDPGPENVGPVSRS